MYAWVQYLRKTASETDRTLFKKIEEKVIGVKAGIEEFRKSNDVPTNIKIGTSEFTSWLRSLGWKV